MVTRWSVDCRGTCSLCRSAAVRPGLSGAGPHLDRRFETVDGIWLARCLHLRRALRRPLYRIACPSRTRPHARSQVLARPRSLMYRIIGYYRAASSTAPLPCVPQSAPCVPRFHRFGNRTFTGGNNRARRDLTEQGRGGFGRRPERRRGGHAGLLMWQGKRVGVEPQLEIFRCRLGHSLPHRPVRAVYLRSASPPSATAQPL
jgi:hypothetical protein